MLRRRHKSAKLRCSIDVSAFVSVMMAILFAVMSTFLCTDLPTQAVGLAKTDHDVLMKGAAREDALVVAITRDGRIFFDNSQVANPGELPLKIQQRIRLGAPPTVYIRADGRAHYRRVARAIDSLHDAGVEKVGLITSPRQRTEDGLLH